MLFRKKVYFIEKQIFVDSIFIEKNCFFCNISFPLLEANPITPAPCTPPPPYPQLLISMSSLIAVGLVMAVIGRGAIVDSAQCAGRPLLFCYCYFVTFSISDENHHSQK